VPPEYREELPNGCPPDEAQEILTEVHVYRLVWHEPPTEDDFRSQRAISPQQRFSAGECLARGLSVCGDIARAEKTRLLPKYQETRICKVSMCAGAGKLLHGGHGHRTWWPYRNFDILAHCETVQT